MKIPCITQMMNMDGTIMKTSSMDDSPFTLGKALAQILMTPTQQKKAFNNLKCWDLSQRFYKDTIVELDNSDFKTIKDIVEKDIINQPIVTTQVTSLLEKLIDKKDEKV